ncbi:MAG: spermidine synthase, partial [Planctomycetota bacterium]
MIESSHVFGDPRRPRRLLRFEEGRISGVSVVEDLAHGNRLLYTDDFLAAETGPKYGYMRMLGHLPMLMHPSPRRVLVIAFGTGTTAGAVDLHEEVEELVCVEIDDAVYVMADLFAAQNRRVLEAASTERIVADGREYVRRETGLFDVVTLEPLPPYTPAAVHLYTLEFYESVRDRLRPDGLLCQWIPIHAVSNADFRGLVRTVAGAFHHVSLWYFEQSAVVLAGERRPVPPERLLDRVADPAVTADLRRALVGDAAHLLASMVAADGELRGGLCGADVMRDDRPALEFRPLPRRFGRRSARYKSENLGFLAGLHATGKALSEPTDELYDEEVRARDSTAAVLRSLALESKRVHEGGEVVPASDLLDVVRRDRGSLLARAVYERRAYAELMARGLPPEARKPRRAAALRLAPDRSRAFLELADRVQGEERRSYLLRALHQNALLPPPVLRELAATLAPAQARFCLNRARVQEGELLEEPPGEMPELDLPEAGPLIEAGDLPALRRLFELARATGREDLVEGEVGAHLDRTADLGAAASLVDEVGSRHALRAALRLRARGGTGDLVAAAPILCRRMVPAWRRLCRHAEGRVRAAAADAAA